MPTAPPQPPTQPPLPVLIVGQGLAGTALAWRLWERGVPFVIADRDEPLTSSKVAAGLITPITGMRLTVSWRYALFYREALQFYRACGRRLGRRFLFPRGYVRLPKNEKELKRWEKCRQDPAAARFIHSREPHLDPAVFQPAEHGFQQRHAAWLDTNAFLESSRRFFEAESCWIKADVRPEEVQEDADGAAWRGRHFSHVIWAQGWQGAQHPLFAWVPFQSAMGTILTVEAALKGERRIVNRGCWLLPRNDGTLRAGSTYEWAFDDPHVPSPELVQKLQDTLDTVLRVPVRVLAAHTAVRPIVKDRQAVMGAHPGHPRMVFFNGLGSKGSLRAPWLARHLVEHLLDGAALDAAFDLQGNSL